MADFTYERGDPLRPVGHALLYFTTGSPDEVQATYIVVPPIMIDFAKYVPPLLASSLGSAGLLAQTSFLPVPPAPEPLDLAELRRMATRRGDDVIVGGSAGAWDAASLMGRVAELGDAYARPDRAGARLAELFIQRGYKLQKDEIEGIEQIDAEIAELQATGREA